MGLIMLILIGCAPTAYALNRTVPIEQTPAFVASASAAATAFDVRANGIVMPVNQARDTLRTALQQRKTDSREVFAALAAESRDIAGRVQGYGSIGKVPAAATPNLRGDMYLVLDTSRLISKKADAEKAYGGAAGLKAVKDYETQLEQGTRFIPLWVKIAVAIALGLGTMVGWKRIVVTVVERIGKQHMTYAMGASAELVAAATIQAADMYGLPVSTTHILSSGVAGASIASGSGLQARTVRNLALAWLLTLPVAMTLSGGLYWLLLQFVGN
jgi:PiT family inorganic phosphate transporter